MGTAAQTPALGCCEAVARLIAVALMAGCAGISTHDRHEFSGGTVAGATVTASHSDPAWRRLRNEHIKAQPDCQVCGIVAKDNQVHHIKQRRTNPELFLDRANLITLCQRHHFWVGHASDWRASNTNLAASITAIRQAAETIQK